MPSYHGFNMCSQRNHLNTLHLSGLCVTSQHCLSLVIFFGFFPAGHQSKIQSQGCSTDTGKKGKKDTGKIQARKTGLSSAVVPWTNNKGTFPNKTSHRLCMCFSRSPRSWGEISFLLVDGLKELSE